MSKQGIDDPNLDYHPFKTEWGERTVTRGNSLNEDQYHRLLNGADGLGGRSRETPVRRRVATAIYKIDRSTVGIIAEGNFKYPPRLLGYAWT